MNYLYIIIKVHWMTFINNKFINYKNLAYEFLSNFYI